MVVKHESLVTLTTGFKALFNKALETTTPKWGSIATLVPSETGEEIYGWLGSLPRMREWLGDRVVKALAENGYRIRNKSFESTVSVRRDDIEDDRYGVYSPLFSKLGEAAAVWPDDLVFGLLRRGTTETCYDGKPFFSTDHPVGGKKTVSNLGTAKLSAASYAAARAAMMSITDEQGAPLKILPDLLVVPPALESTALQLLKAETIDGTTNTYRGTAQLLVAPELAGQDTAWYLLATGGIIKPLIFQQRKAPRLVAHTNDESDKVFMSSEFTYGAEARGNAGFGLWQQAYCSAGTKA